MELNYDARPDACADAHAYLEAEVDIAEALKRAQVHATLALAEGVWSIVDLLTILHARQIQAFVEP